MNSNVEVLPPTVKFNVNTDRPAVYGVAVYGLSLGPMTARYVVKFEKPLTLEADDEIEHRYVRTDNGSVMESWLHRKGEEPRLLGVSAEQTP